MPSNELAWARRLGDDINVPFLYQIESEVRVSRRFLDNIAYRDPRYRVNRSSDPFWVRSPSTRAVTPG